MSPVGPPFQADSLPLSPWESPRRYLEQSNSWSQKVHRWMPGVVMWEGEWRLKCLTRTEFPFRKVKNLDNG